jgi:hypothetical protein
MLPLNAIFEDSSAPASRKPSRFLRFVLNSSCHLRFRSGKRALTFCWTHSNEMPYPFCVGPISAVGDACTRRDLRQQPGARSSGHPRGAYLLLPHGRLPPAIRRDGAPSNPKVCVSSRSNRQSPYCNVASARIHVGKHDSRLELPQKGAFLSFEDLLLCLEAIIIVLVSNVEATLSGVPCLRSCDSLSLATRMLEFLDTVLSQSRYGSELGPPARGLPTSTSCCRPTGEPTCLRGRTTAAGSKAGVQSFCRDRKTTCRLTYKYASISGLEDL